MSRTVHLLRFYEDNLEFIEETASENVCRHFLNCGNRFDHIFNKVVEQFNSERNISNDSNCHKGLSLPKFKMIMALVAQKKGFAINPYLNSKLCLTDTPVRFQKKFKSLLVPGLWLLGTVIEDSLSDDPDVNGGNPFDFIPGDLGFWWAGIVILDWMKYIQLETKDCTCSSFYDDHNLNRKYLYHQNSALSSSDLIPEQFLQEKDKENFTLTITKVDTTMRMSAWEAIKSIIWQLLF